MRPDFLRANGRLTGRPDGGSRLWSASRSFYKFLLSFYWCFLFQTARCSSKNLYICKKLTLTSCLMAKIKGTIVVDKERCKGCGVCVASCPCDVLGLSTEVNSKGYPIAWMVHPDACTGCASCAIICPDSVITVYRQKFE